MSASVMQDQSASPMHGPKIRTLIVDDSVLLRRLLTRMLEDDPAIEIVGTARDGADAIRKTALLKPDVITMDVEMPEMDGIAALRSIQQQHPAVKIVMCSSLTSRGAQATLDALMAGASDYVSKTLGKNGDGETALGEALRVKVKALGRCRATVVPLSPVLTPPAQVTAQVAPSAATPQVLAIGVSTGGPAALAEIMPLLPADLPIPVLIVQHMPPLFSRLLAERLSRRGRIPVVEAAHGMKVQAGCAFLAPGDFHMKVVRKHNGDFIELTQDERENSCRPAVDVLFRSVADVYGGAALAAVLTGMGQDGLRGVQALKAHGARVLVQDKETSVVWGMPGAVASAGLADAVLPLNDLIPEVIRRVGVWK